MRWYVGAISVGLLGIYALCIHWMREMNGRVSRLERIRSEAVAKGAAPAPVATIVEARTSDVVRTLSPRPQRPRGRISFDVGGRLFEKFDAEFIAGVQQRWYDLVDANAVSSSGKAKFGLEMLPDGKLANVQMIEGDVGSAAGDLCKRALVGAVYVPWPAEMVKAIGTGPRRITMTFFYP
jgi:hypothetical protein